MQYGVANVYILRRALTLFYPIRINAHRFIIMTLERRHSSTITGVYTILHKICRDANCRLKVPAIRSILEYMKSVASESLQRISHIVQFPSVIHSLRRHP